MGIGEIVTQSQLASLQKYVEQSWVKLGYVAPTFYRYASASSTSWAYYATLDEAKKQYEFLLKKQGSVAQKAVGYLSFTANATAQTGGVSVDYFYPFPFYGWVQVPYAALREYWANRPDLLVVARFTKTNGSGPYYTVLVSGTMGIAATVIQNISADKLAAYDLFYKELSILKAKYNALVDHLNSLAAMPFNPVVQQSFNEGMLLLNRMQNDMRKIKGVDFTYTQLGQLNGVGALPLVAWVVFAIIATTISWSLKEILTEKERTKQVNAGYDMQKYAQDQRFKIAQAVQAGTISKEDAAKLDAAAQQAAVNAADANKTVLERKDTLQSLGDIAKYAMWLGLGFLAVKALNKQNN